MPAGYSVLHLLLDLRSQKQLSEDFKLPEGILAATILDQDSHALMCLYELCPADFANVRSNMPWIRDTLHGWRNLSPQLDPR